MKNKKRNRIIKIVLLLTVLIIITIYVASSLFSSDSLITSDLSLNEFYALAKNDMVEEVVFTNGEATFQTIDIYGNSYSIINPGNDTFIYDLMMMDINVVIDNNSTSSLISMLPQFLELGLMFAMIFFLARMMGGNNRRMFSVLEDSENTSKFDNVAGMAEIKTEVEDIISRIKDSNKLADLGARPCKGILLYGPPGTGKTLIAKAIAGESNLPFISASGSDFVEMFVGMGASRVRSLWRLAEENAPCVLFIDEIDALGQLLGTKVPSM